MSACYAALTRSFEARELDTSTFGHRDHVGVAYEMLRSGDFVDVAARYADTIRFMATRAGAPDKFHVTITIAFLSLVAERMATTRHADFDDFIACNPDLLSKHVLQRWYSSERLGSDLARNVLLLPEARSRKARASPATALLSECNPPDRRS
jgi:hypothetical protein